MSPSKEEIQQLLLEKITGTIDPQDDVELQQLMEEDEDLRLLWEAMLQEVKELEAQGFSLHGDAEQSWQEIEPLLKRRSHSLIITRLAVAASLLAVLLTIGFLFWRKSPSISFTDTHVSGFSQQKRIILTLPSGQQFPIDTTKEADTLRYENGIILAGKNALQYSINASATNQQWILSVPAAMAYKVTMADGSEVWLNSESTLRFEAGLGSKVRDVYLKGEAYFKVAKDIRRPFSVHTSQGSITVTGTEFNVHAYDKERVQTALVEGSIVAKREGLSALQVKPGYQVVCESGAPFRTSTFDQYEVLSWMKGVHYFHDASLQELAKVLSRWYDVKVQFQNDSVSTKMFSGELLKAQPLSTFLDYVKISADIESHLDKGVLYFK